MCTGNLKQFSATLVAFWLLQEVCEMQLLLTGEWEVISQMKSLGYKVFLRRLLNSCTFVGVEIFKI